MLAPDPEKWMPVFRKDMRQRSVRARFREPKHEEQAMTKVTARRYAWGAIAALVTMLAGTVADAQSSPTRPITVIIPFAGGSASDVVSRIMLDRMSKSMGQPIIVDNKPG